MPFQDVMYYLVLCGHDIVFEKVHRVNQAKIGELLKGFEESLNIGSSAPKNLNSFKLFAIPICDA